MRLKYKNSKESYRSSLTQKKQQFILYKKPTTAHIIQEAK